MIQYLSQQGFTSRCASQFNALVPHNWPDALNVDCDPCLVPLADICRCCCNCFVIHFPGLATWTPGGGCSFSGYGAQDFLLDQGQTFISGLKACRPITATDSASLHCTWGVDVGSAASVTLAFYWDDSSTFPPNCNITYTSAKALTNSFLIIKFNNASGGYVFGSYAIANINCVQPMTLTLRSHGFQGTTCPTEPTWPTTLTLIPAPCGIPFPPPPPPPPGCTGSCTYTPTNQTTTTTSVTTNGSYSTPAQGSLVIKGEGAGAGGGADSTTTKGAQGGGGGENIVSVPIPVVPASVFNHTFSGSGGSGGVSGATSEDGGDGGNASVTGTIAMTAHGGTGGAGSVGSVKNGAGGTGGFITPPGTITPGNSGIVHSGHTGGNGGAGGGSVGGAGGAGGGNNNNGSPGVTPGGGGGGSGGDANGGAGASARIDYVFTQWDWAVVSSCSAGCACRTIDSGFYSTYGRPTSALDVITLACT